MRNHFERQLIQLNKEMIQMGSLIERAIEMAVRALVKRDTELARETIEFDNEIDQQEKDIESLCLKLLLQQQPVAKDLRMISSALKMITDMERIGDHASDISEVTISLVEGSKRQEKIIAHIQEMAKETTVMVVQSVEAFVNKKLETASWVIEHDDIVDDLFRKSRTNLIELVNENKEYGEQATDLLMVAKYFERIGDHATNIAEWVIFSITGIHERYEEEAKASM